MPKLVTIGTLLILPTTTTTTTTVRDYLGEPAPERQNQEGKDNLDLPE